MNRNSSEGYRLNPESVSQTVPHFKIYTLSYRTSIKLSDRLEFGVGLRYFRENQQNQGSVTDENGIDQMMVSDAFRKDFTAKPTLSITPFDQFDVSLRWMTSFFKTRSTLHYADSGALFEASRFNQYYNKPELQTEYLWDNSHHSVIGAGAIFERLNAERYPSRPDFTTRFMFAQHTWMPGPRYEITGGLRYDSHSEYNSQLSPKLSARFELTDRVQLRVSAGRGFKAPDFRQLFLDFTNSTAGYSVYG